MVEQPELFIFLNLGNTPEHKHHTKYTTQTPHKTSAGEGLQFLIALFLIF